MRRRIRRIKELRYRNQPENNNRSQDAQKRSQDLMRKNLQRKLEEIFDLGNCPFLEKEEDEDLGGSAKNDRGSKERRVFN